MTGGPGNFNPKTQNSISSMTHHLDLVRSGVASIETELQQRASLLAVDNANLRNLLENSSSEMTALRIKAQELESTQHKLGMRFPSYSASNLILCLFSITQYSIGSILTKNKLCFSQDTAASTDFG